MSIAILLPPGFKPVIKHGEHDQSSHGNWASGNFDEETQGEDLQNKYFDRYGMNPTTKEPTGITLDEINALGYYTGDGYSSMNGGLRGSKNLSEQEEKYVGLMDKAIDEAPVEFGSTNLYRVFSDKVLDELQEGDIFIDKGYISTTRVDITDEKNQDLRQDLGSISESRDTIAVILPNEKGSGKGIAVDALANAVNEVRYSTLSAARTEKEVLLPRGTPMEFIGYKTDVGTEARIAVFRRKD